MTCKAQEVNCTHSYIVDLSLQSALSAKQKYEDNAKPNMKLPVWIMAHWFDQ